MATITRTKQQALIRARGLWKGDAWVECLEAKRVDEAARLALTDWLDGLTLVHRNLDVIVSQQTGNEPQYRVPIVRIIVELLAKPHGNFVMAYQVGTVHRLGSGLPGVKSVLGYGWSWDEAFEMAEKKIEQERVAREKETSE